MLCCGHLAFADCRLDLLPDGPSEQAKEDEDERNDEGRNTAVGHFSLDSCAGIQLKGAGGPAPR
jgi:hypothetical protein